MRGKGRQWMWISKEEKKGRLLHFGRIAKDAKWVRIFIMASCWAENFLPISESDCLVDHVPIWSRNKFWIIWCCCLDWLELVYTYLVSSIFFAWKHSWLLFLPPPHSHSFTIIDSIDLSTSVTILHRFSTEYPSDRVIKLSQDNSSAHTQIKKSPGLQTKSKSKCLHVPRTTWPFALSRLIFPHSTIAMDLLL